MSAKLLSKAAIDPGVVQVMQMPLTARSGEENFEDRLAKSFLGKSYAELASIYLRNGATILAIRSEKGLKVNPQYDTKLDAGAVIYVAKEKVSLATES